jgi:hypothetical protein
MGKSKRKSAAADGDGDAMAVDSQQANGSGTDSGRPSTSGRPYTVTMAVSSSMIDNTQNIEFATFVAGQVRASRPGQATRWNWLDVLRQPGAPATRRVCVHNTHLLPAASLCHCVCSIRCHISTHRWRARQPSSTWTSSSSSVSEGRLLLPGCCCVCVS